MLELSKLHLKENSKGKIFILFGIIGALITIFVSSSVTFSTNVGGGFSSDYGQYGFQWTFLTFLACLGAVSLSMNTIEKHRKGSFSDLLSLHGLEKKDQYRELALGNVLVSVLMAMILLVGMIVSLFIKQPDFFLFGLVLAILNYLLASSTMAIVMIILSLVFPSVISGLFGVILTILGGLRGILEIILANKGGVFAKVTSVLIKAVPPISNFGQISRDSFFGEFTDWNLLFENLFYIWIVIGILLIVSGLVAKNEK